MNDLWWYVGRATGIVAAVLAVATLMWGFFFSARNTGGRRKANWWLDLHNYLGGLTLVFTAAHLVAIYFDTHSDIGLAQIFIPGTATGATWPIAWGVLATYLFAVTVFTSWPKRRFSRRVWRIVHLTSVIGVIFALLHSFQSGSDATERLFEAGLIACVAFSVYALSLRLIGVIGRALSK